MKFKCSNKPFYMACIYVFLLSIFFLVASGLEWTAEKRKHRQARKLSWTQDSSPPPTVKHEKEPLQSSLPPYLQLPVFRDSQTPLVDPEHFRPVEGTGEDPLPEQVQDLLRPRRTEAPPTEPQPESSVRIGCKHNHMIVEVDRAVLGSSDPQTALSVGSCSPNKITEDYVYFELKLWLNECDTDWSLEDGRVVFYNALHFEPKESQGLIRRIAPFTLELSCFYNRYQYSYLMAFVPKQNVHNLFKRMKSREKFTLMAKNAQWEPLSPSDAFTLGRPMFFEAQIDTLAPGKRLYVHSCYATPEKSPSSEKRFDIVSNYGCMLESKDGHSSFVPSANNAVRFSVDAFIFKDFEGNALHMHCTMSVGPYSPTVTDKSCSFHSDSSRWVELDGSEGVCSCCEFTCGSPAPTEAVISSKALNIDVKRSASAKKQKSKLSGAKRKSKFSPRVSRPEPKEKVEREETVPLSEVVRWAVAEAEPRDVLGSAEVELIKGPEKKGHVFEDIFALHPYEEINV